MLLRTTQTTFHRRSQYSACALIITQCLTSILLLTVECSAQYQLAWSITAANPECPQADRRWYALTALDVMTEALLLFLPIQLVWNLQMTFRTKFIVVSAFWLRLPYVLMSDGAVISANYPIEPSCSLLFARGRYSDLLLRPTSRLQLRWWSSGRP